MKWQCVATQPEPHETGLLGFRAITSRFATAAAIRAFKQVRTTVTVPAGASVEVK